MRILRALSIKHKLRVITMITTGTAVCSMAIAIGFNEVIQQRSFIYEKRKEQLSVLADVIGSRSTAALTFNDQSTAAENLDALSILQAQDNIVFAAIFDHRGKLFAKYQTKPPASLLQIVALSHFCENGYRSEFNTFLPICVPIILDGERLGDVRILFDMQSDLKILKVELFRFLTLIVSVVLITILVALILSSRLQNLVAGPILRLRTAMEAVSKNKDYSVRVSRETDDELGALVEGFNEMLAQIQARDADLARYSTALEEEVVARTKELEEANKRRVTWLENLARFLRHELKNTMVGVQTSLNLMERRAPVDTLATYIARARISVSEMRKLLDSVDKASTMEAAVYKEPKRRLNLTRLIRAKNSDYQDIYPQQPFTCECEDGIEIVGSEGLLRQMLNNLVSNAVEHSKEGAPIVIAVKTRNQQAVLSVANEGDPLPDDRERIFELFVSMRNSDRKGESNIGLGLNLVKLIALSHGGYVVAADLRDQRGRYLP
jgi:signal transduction histidine kinase